MAGVRVDARLEVDPDHGSTDLVHALFVGDVGELAAPDEEHARENFYYFDVFEKLSLLISSLDVFANFFLEEFVVLLLGNFSGTSFVMTTAGFVATNSFPRGFFPIIILSFPFPFPLSTGSACSFLTCLFNSS